MRDIEKFYKKLCTMEYGWYDKKGKLHLSLNDDFKMNFKDFVKGRPYVTENIKFYRYKKPSVRMGCKAFYLYCMWFGKKIKKDKKSLYS